MIWRYGRIEDRFFLISMSFILKTIKMNHQINIIMTLIAIFFPFVSFLLRGKVLTAVLCLILQATFIGWIPAAIWAVLSLQNARADKRTNKVIRAMKK